MLIVESLENTEKPKSRLRKISSNDTPVNISSPKLNMIICTRKRLLFFFFHLLVCHEEFLM